MPDKSKPQGRLLSCIWVVVLTAMLSGCSGGSSNPVKVHTIDADYTVPGTETMDSNPRYLLGPEDKLEIKFIGDSSLNTTLLITPDGFITIPLVEKPIQCAGMTIQEVTDSILSELGKYINNPMIYLNIIEIGSMHVFVLGNVKLPQAVNVKPLTLASAITACGGIHRDGQRKQIIVLRRNPGKAPTMFEVDFTDLLDGKSLAPDIPLQRYDIVIVPKSRVAKMRDWVSAVFANNYAVLRFGLEAIWLDQAIQNELDFYKTGN
ncbi:MAG: hypothetical protein GY835_21755 [bacterium]|nr:hypothetical protein [bacterium]